ncbi:hypothetical protein CCACVL1_09089 [Corchorus capsularis]|uniref:Uncharacterized protein n=1 Tax=Corchorus capsularis TaxID=210143 RepID=A0A1R3IXW8_COCAP|nr:hypothetical protein CCACVL1_09089 [Corchorus capsularis]
MFRTVLNIFGIVSLLERDTILPKAEQKLLKKGEKEIRKVKENKKERKEKEKTHGISKSKKLDDGVIGLKDSQLESSELTEEHGLPVCYLSDGTQNSNNGSQNNNKRKRETSPPTVNGSNIKIRFTFKKPKESDASLSKELVSSTSGRVDSSSQPIAQEQCVLPKVKANIITAPVQEQKQCPLMERIEQSLPSFSSTSRYDSKIKKAALQYEALFENWVPPPPLQLENQLENQDDDDWLFASKKQGQPVAKRTSLVDTGSTCHASAGATSWPRAQFLPEVEIYALPYTVPY